MENACFLSRSLGKVDICVHYSLKWNYEGGVEPAYSTLKSFLHHLEAAPGDQSVLLVSGGGKKKRFETVEVFHDVSFYCTPNGLKHQPHDRRHAGIASPQEGGNEVSRAFARRVQPVSAGQEGSQRGEAALDPEALLRCEVSPPVIIL